MSRVALSAGGLEDGHPGRGGRGRSGAGVGLGPDGKWDQFAANEKLFGVRTSFDENLYTTRLDKASAVAAVVDGRRFVHWLPS